VNWYYKNGEAKIGPVNDKQILELAELGKITSETMVWNEHFIKWQSYGETLDKTRETELNSHSPEEDLPEAAWDSNLFLYSADTENHDDHSDIETTPLRSESYCSKCFKKFADEELVRYGVEKICPACETLFSNELKKNDAASRLPLAGFCIRFVAKLIDGVILGIIGMLLYATAIFLLLWTDAIFMPSARMLIFILVYMCSILSYFAYAVFFVGQYGATPGKLALGLKVVDVDGSKVGYIKALGRCLSEIVSAIPFAFGYIIAAFDTEKRTLHDRICGTRVIVKSAREFKVSAD
jgi:uncharacterized RDD family membrane protein YckC